jgi:hypothetical protein
MPGKFNPWTGYYEVWNTDATAVVEAYFEGMGWFSFDPVPGRDLIPPQPDQTETFSVADQTWKGISQWIPEPLRLFIGSLIAGVAGFLVTIFAWAGLLVSSLGWVGGAILIALTVAITFAGWGAFQAGTWWVRQQKLVRLPPAERRYQEMLRLAAGRGLLKMPQDTPLEFLRQLQQTIPHGAAACGQITHNYLRWRYQGAVIAPEEATAAYQALRQALKTP